MAFWPPAKGEFLRGRRTALFESAGLRYVSDAAWIAPIAKPLSPRVGSLENRDSCPDGFPMYWELYAERQMGPLLAAAVVRSPVRPELEKVMPRRSGAFLGDQAASACWLMALLAISVRASSVAFSSSSVSSRSDMASSRPSSFAQAMSVP